MKAEWHLDLLLYITAFSDNIMNVQTPLTIFFIFIHESLGLNTLLNILAVFRFEFDASDFAKFFTVIFLFVYKHLLS